MAKKRKTVCLRGKITFIYCTWGERWMFEIPSIGLVTHYPGKLTALRHAQRAIRKIVASGGSVSLRIHDKDGRFQEERTYPRAADPKHRKG